MTQFIPGLKLSELFFREAVQPILARHWPDLKYSAGRLDFGSDVLGFDTPQSRDHDWGPRLTLWLRADDCDRYEDEVWNVLAEELPVEMCGYPTNWDPAGDWQLVPTSSGPIHHKVTITTVPGFFREYLGVDPTAPIAERDWLAIPSQRLRTIASGGIFCDGLRQMAAARQALAWYPRDVWLYLMANQWRRIEQEEPFMGRCGDVGDDLGSRIVAMRLIDNLMRLCFLIERSYAPYTKWFGTAFGRLACADRMLPLFRGVLQAEDWQQRQQHLSKAYLVVMQMHNELQVTPRIEPKVWAFHKRPYMVPHAERFVEALHAAIRSETVKAWPAHVGAIWQLSDSTDVLDSIERCRAFAGTYAIESDTT